MRLRVMSGMSWPIDAAGAGSSARGVTRRQVLAAGAGAGIALAALESDPAGADPSTAPGSARGPRSELSFDEDWRFYRGDASGAQAPSFNDSGWRKLDVPHDWRIEDLPYATSDDDGATANPSGFSFLTSPSPDGTAPQVIGPFDANADPVPDLDITIPGFGRIVFPGGRSQGYTVAGVGWYRKQFTVPKRGHNGDRAQRAGDEQLVELRFDGVFGRSDVWLNGVHLGFHPNGYTSFAYDLTPYLNRGGQNVLAVRVDNTGKTSRWYSGSGIYRHTWLTVTGPVRIPRWGVNVTTPVVDQQQVGGACGSAGRQLRGAGGGECADDRLGCPRSPGRDADHAGAEPEYGSDANLRGGRRDLRRGAVVAGGPEPVPGPRRGPPRWPCRRRRHDRRSGSARSCSTARSGSCSTASRTRCTVPTFTMITDRWARLRSIALRNASIETFKAAGFNAIRASHNPRSPAMLDACDRLGMLVWNEFSDMWDIAKTKDDYSNYFADWWQADLTQHGATRSQSPQRDHLVDRERDLLRSQRLWSPAGGPRPLAGHDQAGLPRRYEPAQRKRSVAVRRCQRFARR